MQKYQNNLQLRTGLALSGATLRVYLAGTSTLATLYEDNESTTKTQPLTTDNNGEFSFKAADGDYDIVVDAGPGYEGKTYSNVHLEDYTDTTSALVNTSDVTKGDALIGFRQSNASGALSGAVARTVHQKLQEFVSVKDFSAVGDGVTDDTSAIQAAVNAVIANGGGSLYIPSGTYLLNGAAGSDFKKNGILIPYSSQSSLSNRIRIFGDGRSTILKAGSTGMYIVRFADSYGQMEHLSFDGAGLGTTTGLGVVPADTTQTSTLVFQNFNRFLDIEIRGCTEGLELKCGPDVSGSDSGCWYNEFYGLNVYFCTRSIWMRDGPNAGSSGVNRNKFIGGRCGQSMNTGVQIDSGGSNEFHGMSFEGIDSGTSPNATPTGIKIAANGTYSGANESNRFFGCQFEACTRDVDNANAYTEFYGCNIFNALWTAEPQVIVGGYDSSQVPQKVLGSVYQNNGQFSAYGNGLTLAALANKTATTAFAVGTVAASGGTASTTILAARTNKIVYFEGHYWGFENTNSGAIVMRFRGIARWNGSTLTQYGGAEISEDESLGLADWRAAAYLSISLSASNNAVVCTLTNSGTGTLQSTRLIVNTWELDS